MVTIEEAHPFTFRNRMAETRRQIGRYVFSHWNTLEWIFTARLIIDAIVFMFAPRPDISLRAFATFGVQQDEMALLVGGIAIVGVLVSAQWVRGFWPNIVFAILVFTISLFAVTMFLFHGVFDSPLLYIHAGDIALSGWLIKRVMREKLCTLSG
jgi:hypothetical protein